MNIFITGSNGFVGSRLMWHLESLGHTVCGIDKRDECLIEKHPQTRNGDIRNINDLHIFNQDEIDLIIHCAADKHDWGISKESYFSNNEYGTKILTDYARERNIKKVIYYSTVSVYGHASVPCDEAGEIQPDNEYGESKLGGEKVIEKWLGEDETRECVFLRPTIIYGPFNYANMYNLVDMQHKKPLFMVGNGDHVKSIVSLANLVDMTVFVIPRMDKGLQIYNCIDKPYISLHRLMEIIADNKGFSMPLIAIPLKLAVFIGKFFDIIGKIVKKDLPINSDRLMKLATSTEYHSEKIRELDYTQKYTIESEIKRTTDWYLKKK